MSFQLFKHELAYKQTSVRFLSDSSQAHHISAVSVYLIYLFSLLTVQMCALYVHMC